MLPLKRLQKISCYDGTNESLYCLLFYPLKTLQPFQGLRTPQRVDKRICRMSRHRRFHQSVERPSESVDSIAATQRAGRGAELQTSYKCVRFCVAQLSKHHFKKKIQRRCRRATSTPALEHGVWRDFESSSTRHFDANVEDPGQHPTPCLAKKNIRRQKPTPYNCTSTPIRPHHTRVLD